LPTSESEMEMKREKRTYDDARNGGKQGYDGLV
jgi:hypothetical protein